jgi:hypothetical protein
LRKKSRLRERRRMLKKMMVEEEEEEEEEEEVEKKQTVEEEKEENENKMTEQEQDHHKQINGIMLSLFNIIPTENKYLDQSEKQEEARFLSFVYLEALFVKARTCRSIRLIPSFPIGPYEVWFHACSWLRSIPVSTTRAKNMKKRYR